jgi:hypothetical protein
MNWQHCFWFTFGSRSVPAVHAGAGKLLAGKGGGGGGMGGQAGGGDGGLTEGGGSAAHHLGLQAARRRRAAETAFAHVVVHRRNLKSEINVT